MRVFLRRVYEDKRAWIVPLAVALAANLAIYVLAVFPLGRKIQGASDRVQTAQQAVRAAQTTYASAQSMATGKQEAGEELRMFYDDVLPIGLAGARRMTYVRLAQLATDSGLSYERRTVRTEAETDALLSRLEMTMVLAGAYDDVRRFIYQVETAPEFLVIEDVALAQGEDDEAPLVLTVAVSTYYRPDDNGT